MQETSPVRYWQFIGRDGKIEKVNILVACGEPKKASGMWVHSKGLVPNDPPVRWSDVRIVEAVWVRFY